MKIELKNIKVYTKLSEETNCYTASLYVDGKRIGYVANRGCGGPDEFDGDDGAYNRADKWLEENHPGVYVFDRHLTMNLEMYCAELVSDYLMLRELRSGLKKEVWFEMPGETDLFRIKFKGEKQITDEHIRYVRNKHPEAVIYNELSINDARARYTSFMRSNP